MHGDTHPATLSIINHFATVLHSTQKFDEAERLYRQSIQNCGGGVRTSSGEKSHTLQAKHHLASLLLQRIAAQSSDAGSTFLNRKTVLDVVAAITEAASLCREAIAGRMRMLGATHADTVASVSLLTRLRGMTEGTPAFKYAFPTESVVKTTTTAQPTRSVDEGLD